MYPGQHAQARADQPAVVMARIGRSDQLSRARGAQQPAGASPARGRPQAARPLRHLHGEPSALRRVLRGRRALGALLHLRQFVLTAPELAFIVNNSLSKVLITSQAKRDDRARGARRLPQGRALSHRRRARRRRRACAISTRRRPIVPQRQSPDETLGAAMLYSSGTTGQAQGRAASAARPAARRAAVGRSPHGSNALAISRGPDLSLARAALSLGAAGRRRRHDQARRDGHRHGAVRRRTLPCARRAISRHPYPARADHVLAHAEAAGERCAAAYDLTSLEVAIHAAAPCPIPVKQAMIDWWGPIILEYYSATEAMGMTLLRQRGMARPSRHGRQAGVRRASRSRRRDARGSGRRDRQALVQDRFAVRIFQRSGQDRRGELARRNDEHASATSAMSTRTATSISPTAPRS